MRGRSSPLGDLAWMLPRDSGRSWHGFDAMPGSNNGGSTNQFQTVTLYLYQTAFQNASLGYASAIAWVLFLIIILVAGLNFWLTRRAVR